MSDTPRAGGNRRIDQILAAGFTVDLEALDTREVRRRRDLARVEREYLSFLRRLLQGRRDLLRDEIDRRRTGGEMPPVVERVISVLSEGTRGPSRGEAPMIPIPEDEIAMARRRVERLLHPPVEPRGPVRRGAGGRRPPHRPGGTGGLRRSVPGHGGR
jgi:hypothetical protein